MYIQLYGLISDELIISYSNTLLRKLIGFQCNKLTSVDEDSSQASTTRELCWTRWPDGTYAVDRGDGDVVFHMVKQTQISRQLFEAQKHKGRDGSLRGIPFDTRNMQVTE
jgi:hypothetical protein